MEIKKKRQPWKWPTFLNRRWVKIIPVPSGEDLASLRSNIGFWKMVDDLG
jgi:hypothetical protein